MNSQQFQNLQAVTAPEGDQSETVAVAVEVQPVRQHPAEPDSVARHEALMFAMLA